MAEVAQQFNAFSYNPTAKLDLYYSDANNQDSYDQVHNCRDSFSFPHTHPDNHAFSSRSSDRNPCLQTDHASACDHGPQTPSSDARTPAVLPAFNFHSSAHTTVPEDDFFPLPITTPTASAPSSPTNMSTSHRRHRRTVSELVGGAEGHAKSAAFRRASIDQASMNQSLIGIPIHMPTSGSSPARRGHRHQRSGVFASQDAQTIGSSSFRFGGETNDRSSSAESSRDSPVAEQSFSDWTFPAPGASLENSYSQASAAQPQTPARSPSRTRVEFSDHVEVIPRPTSLVSYESGSSVSTIRESSGSISTILNESSGSPFAKNVRSPWKSITFDDQPLRPRSASPVMRTRLLRFGGEKSDAMPQRPTSAGSSPRSRSHLYKSTSADFDTAVQKVDSRATSLRQNPSWSQVFGIVASPAALDGDALAEEGSYSGRASTDLSENFDDDPTSIIVSGPPRFDIPLWKPYYGGSTENTSREATSPMIDLDDALDPILASTPDSRLSKGRSFSTARQSMHSSNLSSGFFGTGMHYHRRAESEPSVVRHDFETASSGRRTSAAGHEQAFEMENVFEEDEEDSPAPTFNPSYDAVIEGKHDGDPLAPTYGSLADPFVESEMSKSPDAKDFILHHPQFDQARQQTNHSDMDTCSCADTRNIDSRSVGATSLDIRHSVDDVPSLMSSGSTMTDAVHVPIPSISSRGFVPRSTASSLSLAVESEKRRKRSSIASFSRFIASPFSDKHTAIAERRKSLAANCGQPTKDNKGSRLSRLFRFLKV